MTKGRKAAKIILALAGIILSLAACVLFIIEITDTAHSVNILHTVKTDFGLGAQSLYLYKTEILSLAVLCFGLFLCAVMYPLVFVRILKGKRNLKMGICTVIISAVFVLLACLAVFRSSPYENDLPVKQGIAFRYNEETLEAVKEQGDVFALHKSDMWYSLGRQKDNSGSHFIAGELNSGVIRICGYEELYIFERGVDIAHTSLPVIVTEAYAEKLGWEKGQTIKDVYFMTDIELDFVDYDDGSHEALVKEAPYSFSVTVVNILEAGERYPVLSGSPISADTVFPAVKEGDLAVFCPEMYYEGEKITDKSSVIAAPEICIIDTEDETAFEKLSELTEAKKLSELYN